MGNCANKDSTRDDEDAEQDQVITTSRRSSSRRSDEKMRMTSSSKPGESPGSSSSPASSSSYDDPQQQQQEDELIGKMFACDGRGVGSVVAESSSYVPPTEEEEDEASAFSPNVLVPPTTTTTAVPVLAGRSGGSGPVAARRAHSAVRINVVDDEEEQRRNTAANPSSSKPKSAGVAGGRQIGSGVGSRGSSKKFLRDQERLSVKSSTRRPRSESSRGDNPLDADEFSSADSLDSDDFRRPTVPSSGEFAPSGGGGDRRVVPSGVAAVAVGGDKHPNGKEKKETDEMDVEFPSSPARPYHHRKADGVADDDDGDFDALHPLAHPRSKEPSSAIDDSSSSEGDRDFDDDDDDYRRVSLPEFASREIGQQPQHRHHGRGFKKRRHQGGGDGGTESSEGSPRTPASNSGTPAVNSRISPESVGSAQLLGLKELQRVLDQEPASPPQAPQQHATEQQHEHQPSHPSGQPASRQISERQLMERALEREVTTDGFLGVTITDGVVVSNGAEVVGGGGGGSTTTDGSNSKRNKQAPNSGSVNAGYYGSFEESPLKLRNQGSGGSGKGGAEGSARKQKVPVVSWGDSENSGRFGGADSSSGSDNRQQHGHRKKHAEETNLMKLNAGNPEFTASFDPAQADPDFEEFRKGSMPVFAQLDDGRGSRGDTNRRVDGISSQNSPPVSGGGSSSNTPKTGSKHIANTPTTRVPRPLPSDQVPKSVVSSEISDIRELKRVMEREGEFPVGNMSSDGTDSRSERHQRRQQEYSRSVDDGKGSSFADEVAFDEVEEFEEFRKGSMPQFASDGLSSPMVVQRDADSTAATAATKTTSAHKHHHSGGDVDSAKQLHAPQQERQQRNCEASSAAMPSSSGGTAPTTEPSGAARGERRFVPKSVVSSEIDDLRQLRKLLDNELTPPSSPACTHDGSGSNNSKNSVGKGHVSRRNVQAPGGADRAFSPPLLQASLPVFENAATAASDTSKRHQFGSGGSDEMLLQGLGGGSGSSHRREQSANSQLMSHEIGGLRELRALLEAERSTSQTNNNDGGFPGSPQLEGGGGDAMLLPQFLANRPDLLVALSQQAVNSQQRSDDGLGNPLNLSSGDDPITGLARLQSQLRSMGSGAMSGVLGGNSASRELSNTRDLLKLLGGQSDDNEEDREADEDTSNGDAGTSATPITAKINGGKMLAEQGQESTSEFHDPEDVRRATSPGPAPDPAAAEIATLLPDVGGTGGTGAAVVPPPIAKSTTPPLHPGSAQVPFHSGDGPLGNAHPHGNHHQQSTSAGGVVVGRSANMLMMDSYGERQQSGFTVDGDYTPTNSDRVTMPDSKGTTLPPPTPRGFVVHAGGGPAPHHLEQHLHRSPTSPKATTGSSSSSSAAATKLHRNDRSKPTDVPPSS